MDQLDLISNLTIFRPRDGELTEFHPKATRTLFVGNISREVRTESRLLYATST